MYTVTGELSHDNASAVAAAGLSAIAAGQLEFDLSAMTKIDSSAVAVLIAWQRQAIERGMQLQFSGYSANLLSLLTLYGLNEQFQLHPSERH